jgi:hypothetical protein
LYGAAWIGCAALYVPVLYLREHMVELIVLAARAGQAAIGAMSRLRQISV